MRCGRLTKWSVIVITLAATAAGPASYLCITEQGILRIEHAWSGGCLGGIARYANSDGPLRVTARGGPCGACTDIRLCLDSPRPSDTERVIRLILAAHYAASVCDPQIRPIEITQGVEPAINPPPDATLSAVRTVVLTV